MDAIKIVTPKPGMQAGYGVKIYASDGVEIPYVTSININIEMESMITAEVGLCVGACDINAHPLLSLKSLKEAAEVHGYILVPND